jgi:diguanylate cyclase (GGDEF)-like protein
VDIFEYINQQPKSRFLTLGYLLVLLVGIIDYITGVEISFSVFYLFPISLVAWVSNRRGAAFVSVLATLTWLAADLAGSQRYFHPLIPYWNATVRLAFFLVVSILISTLKKNLTFEERMARNDFLTGVGNTRLLYELAYREIKRSRRYGRPVSLLYLDLDNFKIIKDRFGHNTGDNVLKLGARAILKNVRETDTVTRLGGDEFAILLPETGLNQTEVVANNLLKNLSGEMERNKWPVTFSIGAYTFVNPPESVDEMIRCADNQMYLAKNGGKNTLRTGTNSSNIPD